MSELTYRKEFAVHSYETDFRGRVRVLSLMNYLQDAAVEHAGALGYSVTDLGKKNLTWVLSRYHLKVTRYPVRGERLIVETWPSKRSGLFSLRDFDVKDGDGRNVLTATSSWMMIDLGKKQPVKVDEILPPDTVVAKRALVDDFKSLPALESPEREVRFRAEMGHLDLNRHVNHAVYVRWALETVPPDILSNLFPLDLEIAYRGEAVYGDEVRALARSDGAGGGSRFLHQIVNAKSGAELTRLRTRWGKG